MKLWLLDILACPIDKHYPLKLFIFSIETKKDVIQSYYKFFQERDIEEIKSQGIIEIIKEPENLYVKDNIVLKKTPVEKYIKKVLVGIDELENVEDKSSNEIFTDILKTLKDQIKSTLKNYLKEEKYKNIEQILPELLLLNKVKLNIEIESGILFCSKCKRWYPLIDTIPQMLPDEYRDKNKDLKFLKTNKNLLSNKLIDLSLKPFDIEKN